MFAGFADLGTGAPIILLLGVLSVFSLALIVYKIAQLWSVTSKSDTREAALNSFESGNLSEAQAKATHGQTPANRVFGVCDQVPR